MGEERIKDIYQMWNESPIDLGSVIPQFHLFEAVKKFSGYRFVLSGDGADELFGGYKRIHEFDSQKSDIFDELSYYHLPRLDKMSMAHTLELRSPFLNLDIVRFALHLPLQWRKDKQILKRAEPQMKQMLVDEYGMASVDVDMLQDLLGSEVEATLFGLMMQGEKVNLPKPVQGVFNKIKAFLERLGNAVRGLGFKNYKDIFQDINEGKYADVVDAMENVAEQKQLARLPQCWSMVNLSAPVFL
jgi:hypothetical protein